MGCCFTTANEPVRAKSSNPRPTYQQDAAKTIPKQSPQMNVRQEENGPNQIDFPENKSELIEEFASWRPNCVWDFRSIYKVLIDDSLDKQSHEKCFVFSLEKKLSTQTEAMEERRVSRPSNPSSESKYPHFMYFAYKVGPGQLISLQSYILKQFRQNYTYADAVKVIKAVCQAIEEDSKVSVSLNVENILVLQEEPLKLKLFPMMEIDDKLLEDNKFLKRRWNAQIEQAEVNQSELIVKHQNKLNLAIMAFWLESDGHLPLKVYENARSIINDRAFRQKYIEELGETATLYKFIIQNFESSLMQIRQSIDLKLKTGGRDKQKLSNNFIGQKFIKGQALLYISNEMLEQYKGLEDSAKQNFKLQLMKFTRSQALKSMESFHEFLDFLQGKVRFRQEKLLQLMSHYKFYSEYMRDFKNKAILLQLLSLLEHHDRYLMRKEFITEVL